MLRDKLISLFFCASLVASTAGALPPAFTGQSQDSSYGTPGPNNLGGPDECSALGSFTFMTQADCDAVAVIIQSGNQGSSTMPYDELQFGLLQSATCGHSASTSCPTSDSSAVFGGNAFTQTEAIELGFQDPFWTYPLGCSMYVGDPAQGWNGDRGKVAWNPNVLRGAFGGAANPDWAPLCCGPQGCWIDPNAATPAPASSNGDPHIHWANGGVADFRGRDNTTVNVLSAPNISLGLRVTESHFRQRWKDNPDCDFFDCSSDSNLQTVHGTHFTKAFFVLRSNVSGHMVNISMDSDVNPWYKPFASVEPINFPIPEAFHTAKHVFSPRRHATAVKLATDHAQSFVHEDLAVSAPNNHRVTVRAAGWQADVTRRRLFKPLPKSKTNSYLDIVLQPLDEYRHTTAHGLIGQSFGFTSPKTNGKRDDYSKPEVTTSAQAEGVIEGVGTDYELASEYDVHFKYSLFDSKARAVAHTKLALSTGSTETSEAVDLP